MSNFPRFRPITLYRLPTVEVTPADIYALNTTPKLLFAAQDGYLNIPVLGHLYREAGVAYVANGATQLQVRVVGSASAFLNTFNLASLTDTVAATVTLYGPNTTAGTQLSGSHAAANFLNAGIELFAAGGNPTTGTGSLFLTVWCHHWPHARLTSGQ